MKYLVVKCEELDDQWECDAKRIPIYVGDNIKEYNRRGYEIYEIHADGSLELARDYDEVAKEGWCICFRDADGDECAPPKQVIELGAVKPSKSFLKRLKKTYGFKETVENIDFELDHGGEYGEEIGSNWVVIGEFYDDRYPTGC